MKLYDVLGLFLNNTEIYLDFEIDDLTKNVEFFDSLSFNKVSDLSEEICDTLEMLGFQLSKIEPTSRNSILITMTKYI